MTTQRIAVTGATGFIGRHVVRRLGAAAVSIDRSAFQDPRRLTAGLADCGAVVHLAAMNRGDDHALFETNVHLMRQLCEALSARPAQPHILFASTIQRDTDTPYGRSKREAESMLVEQAQRHGWPVTILVIPNIFGPGCRPFYNSVVATFCHQLVHGLAPQVFENRTIELLFVDDLAKMIGEELQQLPLSSPRIIAPGGTTRLGVQDLLHQLREFHRSFYTDGIVPQFASDFQRQLYATFMSYVPAADHCHQPLIHQDERGRLFEIIKTAGGGQVFFSTTRPGVIRGNHFHTRKIEWFCVVQGKARICLRPIGSDQVISYDVSGQDPRFISIPAYHSHSIENIGEDDLLTMFWCSELFVPQEPDTYSERVA